MKLNTALHKILCTVATCCIATVCLSSCADEDGMHDQNALFVTFEFEEFGENVSGAYAIPGNFNNWSNASTHVTLTKGAGTSIKMAVTVSNIQFTLVPVNSWTRDWYVEGTVEGNGSDSGTMWNFYLDGLDLNAGEVTVLIDASSGTATPVIQ